MATSSIADALSGTETPTTTATPNRFSELTSQDFVKIMFTELSNQDPLKPNDSNTLLQQFSSLRNIEADISLQDKLTSVVNQGQLSTAGALLGKHVVGYTENLDIADGIVRSISQTKDGPILNLSDGSRVPFKNIGGIEDATIPTNTPATPTTPTTPTDPSTPATPSTNPPVVPLLTPGSTTTPAPNSNPTSPVSGSQH